MATQDRVGTKNRVVLFQGIPYLTATLSGEEQLKAQGWQNSGSQKGEPPFLPITSIQTFPPLDTFFICNKWLRN